MFRSLITRIVPSLQAWTRRAVLKADRIRDRKPDDDYAARLARENARFAQDFDVHALPEIAHYWSNKYLLPMEREMGFSHPEEFLGNYLMEAAARTESRPARFVSLGAGNCDAEVRIAQELHRQGLHAFTLECVEINPAMRERGAALAAESGVAEHVIPVHGDFNHWRPESAFDAVMANQSLHHVTELEDLFDSIRNVLKPEGLLITSDMIGRNGHQRWPEALALVREFWQELPESYRFNLQLQRQEPEFLDWDCSTEGFEGVRAQDILPLLIERFEFELFLPFGNLIDPFIDRGFGHHFDADRERDRDFIDRVHARDEAEIQAGRIKPTHMMAVLKKQSGGPRKQRLHLTPQFCLRRPDPG
jgi:SAM-dependent methyltransferase